MVAPTVSWTLSRSPNDGNHTKPDDPLENGDYTFIAQVYDYAVPYTVTVSGVPDTPKQYTVTVNGGDGATGDGEYMEGDEVTITAGTKVGYTFINWTATGVTLSNPDSSTITFNMPGNDVTLTANFMPDEPVEPKQFTVTVNAGNGATGAGQYKEGDEVTVTAGTKVGYTFTNWTDTGVTLSNSDSATITFDMPKNAVTLTANWTVYNPGGGSSSSDDDDDDYTPPTTTEKHPDGSTTTTTTTGGTKTETTKRPDGSKEVVKTDKNGTVTTTATDKNGNQTETIRKPDGSSHTTITNTDGSSSSTSITSSGRVESTVKLPAGVVGNKPVSLPIPEVPVTSEHNHASTITVTLPENTSAKVEIPVKQPTPGAVAVLVKADGTESIIKTSVTTDNGVTVTLQDGDTVKIVDNSKTYTDVPSNYWGANDIQFTSSRELFTGTSANTFSPDVSMDRAMFWTVLARYDGVDTNGGPTWYQMGQVWAVNRGISDGAAPNSPITREQLVTMLYRYAQSTNQDVSARESLSRYQDQHQVSSLAQEAMAWATAEGLLSGTSANTLSPGGLATRAEVAALLTRYCTWSA